MSSSMYQSTKVKELHDSDFNGSTLSNRKYVPGLVMFYSSTCPFCMSKRDDYIDLANRFNGKSKFNILAVDTRDKNNQAISKRLEIEGVPTFYQVGQDGRLTEYSEPFNKDAIVIMAYKVMGKESSALSEELPEDTPIDEDEEDEAEAAEAEEAEEADEADEEEEEDEEETEISLDEDALSAPSIAAPSMSNRSLSMMTQMPQGRSIPLPGADLSTMVSTNVEQTGGARLVQLLSKLSLKELQKLAREFKKPISKTKKDQINVLISAKK